MKKFLNYFTTFEKILFLSSLCLIIVPFCIFGGDNYMTLISALVGSVSLILCAKGNPLGVAIMIVFALCYGFISYFTAYYGEMITYLGMSLPMSVVALVSWLKNPAKEGERQVKVKRISAKEVVVMLCLTLIVTFGFYFILKWLNNANLIFSTISVATSFAAAYLTFKRSPFYALAYALNDMVLIVLWVLITVNDITYISVVSCFVVFLFNDLYGFCSWIKMQKRQSN